ncbi:MAG: hypothetical protein IT488_10485 [Gammaproteobacteria bacterium]|nr:hypothetical protein [Gammaproteobacteria bacterium]
MNDIKDEIRQLLLMASEHDITARECRSASGRLLAELRQGRSPQEYSGLIHEMGLNTETVQILIQMGAGGMEAQR